MVLLNHIALKGFDLKVMSRAMYLACLFDMLWFLQELVINANFLFLSSVI